MDLAVKNRQPNYYKQVTNIFLHNSLSHAYLVETNNNDKNVVRNYILFLVKKIYEGTYDEKVTLPLEKILYLVEKNEYPDYVEIEPVNNQIKKEQLLNIKELFANKSVYGTKQVYVVYSTSKMNASAANTILKFLEEPNEDIIAILVTNNQYNVLDTIRSRCQIISLRFESNLQVAFSEDMLAFFDDIAKRKENDLLLNFNIYIKEIFKDKERTVESVKKALLYYTNLLNISSNSKLKKENSLEELVSIIAVFEESLNKLNYNVNMKLWIDQLLLSLMEV